MALEGSQVQASPSTGRRIRLVDPRPFERIMVFVDGGYLRELCLEFFGNDNIKFDTLRKDLVSAFNNQEGGSFQANLIRIYYYDAIVREGHRDFKKQNEYFDRIRDTLYFSVRLGELVESSNKGFKQKGVDTIMAIDALTKAYQNQYDVAIFIAGDRDLVPLLNAIRDTGKKIFLITETSHCSPELTRSSDVPFGVQKSDVRKWLD